MLRLAITAILALTPLAAGAVTLLPSCATGEGNCGVSDIIATLLNLVEIGIGMIGAVALLYFIYGGFTFVLAAGESEKIKKGKMILTQATIGIVIIFTSGIIVRFATEALTGQTGGVCLVADANKTCTPIIGQVCIPGNTPTATGYWVSIPAGTQKKEGLECVLANDCASLNDKLEAHGVDTRYSCQKVDTAPGTCVRGLCGSKPADEACCTTSAAKPAAK